MDIYSEEYTTSVKGTPRLIFVVKSPLNNLTRTFFQASWAVPAFFSQLGAENGHLLWKSNCLILLNNQSWITNNRWNTVTSYYNNFLLNLVSSREIITTISHLKLRISGIRSTRCSQNRIERMIFYLNYKTVNFPKNAFEYVFISAKLCWCIWLYDL